MFVYKQNQENFDMKKKISEQIQQNLIEVYYNNDHLLTSIEELITQGSFSFQRNPNHISFFYFYRSIKLSDSYVGLNNLQTFYLKTNREISDIERKVRNNEVLVEEDIDFLRTTKETLVLINETLKILLEEGSISKREVDTDSIDEKKYTFYYYSKNWFHKLEELDQTLKP